MGLFLGANLLLVSGRVSSHDIFMTFVSWRLVNDMIFHSARWYGAYIKGNSMDAWIVGTSHFYTIPIPLPFQNPLKYGHGMGNLWEKGVLLLGVNFAPVPCRFPRRAKSFFGRCCIVDSWVSYKHPSSRRSSTWKVLKVYIHPWRLTWNIIMEVWKIIFLSKWVLCRFHVNLPGCIYILYIYFPNIQNRKPPTLKTPNLKLKYGLLAKVSEWA